MLRNTLIRLSFGGLLALSVAAVASAQPAPAGPTGGPAAGFAPGTSFSNPEQASTGCAPPMLFRARIRNISPGVAAADRSAQPRELWRQGSKFLRTDELPDPLKGDEVSVIIAEPEVWSFDRASRRGRHSQDPGPVLEVRAPILPPMPGLPEALQALEYGCEAAFIMANAPRPQRMVNWGSTQAALHAVVQGEHSVAIIWDPKRNEPLMISYLRAGQPVMVIRYDEYQHGMPERPALFVPPKNIAFDDGSGAVGRLADGPKKQPNPNKGGMNPKRPMGDMPIIRPLRPRS